MVIFITFILCLAPVLLWTGKAVERKSRSYKCNFITARSCGELRSDATKADAANNTHSHGYSTLVRGLGNASK